MKRIRKKSILKLELIFGTQNFSGVPNVPLDYIFKEENDDFFLNQNFPSFFQLHYLFFRKNAYFFI